MAEEARERTPADERVAPHSDEEGEDLMKESGNIVGMDSSDDEDDDDDEEEQRRVAEGFIVDENEEDEEEGGESTHKRKRRHRHRELDEELDEDDLALLSENTRPEGARCLLYTSDAADE